MIDFKSEVPPTKTMSLVVLSMILSCSSFARQVSFQIHTAKKITPDVDRFYEKDGNAFATVFCRSDVQQVMIVDSRLPDQLLF